MDFCTDEHFPGITMNKLGDLCYGTYLLRSGCSIMEWRLFISRTNKGDTNFRKNMILLTESADGCAKHERNFPRGSQIIRRYLKLHLFNPSLKQTFKYLSDLGIELSNKSFFSFFLICSYHVQMRTVFLGNW